MVDDNQQGLEVLIGEEILHQRLHNNLTATELGVAVGISKYQVHQHEAGRGALTVSRLVAIADALHVHPAHFLRVRKYVPPPTDLLMSAGVGAIGPVSSEDLRLAAKIARIRDDAARHDLLISIEELVDAMLKTEPSATVASSAD